MELTTLDEGFDPTPGLSQNPGVSLTFYTQVCRNPAKSLAEGRPIFEEREFVRIMVAGDRGNILERPATAQDRKRYAAKYRDFKATHEQKDAGFPLSEWPGVTRSQVEELKYFKILTVEDLANVSDVNGQHIPQFMELRRKAQRYLEALKEAAPLEKVQNELASRDAQIALLQKQVEQLLKLNQIAEEPDEELLKDDE